MSIRYKARLRLAVASSRNRTSENLATHLLPATCYQNERSEVV